MAKANILDMLNEDCWRLVLDLLHIEDIIRSERVSRGWQHVVLRYLQEACFSIEYPWYRQETTRKYHILKMDEDDQAKLTSLTRKWGPCVRKADCISEASLKVLRKGCPNLEDVAVTDKCIKHWLEKESIEELVIWASERVSGLCLVGPLSSKLKSLCLKECEALEFRHLLAAAEHLQQLRKLELMYVPKEIVLNAHLLLERLPHLEDLSLRWEKRLELGDEAARRVAALRLRRLDARRNPDVGDAWLAAAAPGFRRLAELQLDGCLGVSWRGVLAACGAAGGALRVLNVASNRHLQDCHVEQILRLCPNLEWLDVSFCWGLTEGAAARAGAARGARGTRALRLVADNTVLQGLEQEKYPWLVLDFGD